MNKRPVSVVHLVLGLVFLGASALWAIGAGTDADVPDLALLGPAVLIGAGVIGLIGVVANTRRRAVPLDDQTPYADTGVTREENPR